MTHQAIGDLFSLAKGRKAPEVFEESAEGIDRYIQIEDLRSDSEMKYAKDAIGTKVVSTDICIAWDGANAGTVGYGLTGLIGSTIARLRPVDVRRAFTPYVARYLQGKFEVLNQSTTGATIPHVSRDKLLGLKLALPQYDEQRRIAAILDKADAIRKKRRDALMLADEFLRSVYLSAVKSAQDVSASTLSLLDIFGITTGKLDSNAAEKGGIYPFFTCAQETSKINSYAFDREALLLAGNNANGDYSIKHYKGKFNAYQRTYVLSLKDERHSYGFFKYAVESKLSELKRMSKGSNTKYLTLGILAEQRLIVPDEEIQLRFAFAYQKVEALKQSLHGHLTVTNDLFLSLSNRAFQGQL